MTTDYKALWGELINLLNYLSNENVREIHIQLLKEYMSLMVDRENARTDEKSS